MSLQRQNLSNYISKLTNHICAYILSESPGRENILCCLLIICSQVEGYKARMFACEKDLRDSTCRWESHERFMDSEICCLAKSLKKVMDEKMQLQRDMNKLKICLQQSMDALEHFVSSGIFSSIE